MSTTPEQELLDRLQSIGAAKKPTAPTEDGEVEQAMAKGDPDFSTPVTMRNLFTHHDTHPVVLDFALLKAFGPEWFLWEPETLWAEIQRVFSTQISELSRSKIRVVQTVHSNSMPWQKWQVFEKVVQGLSNNIPNFYVSQPAKLEQLYVAVDILDSLRRVPFSDEVKTYMAGCVLEEQVFYVPPPLDFIQVEVAQPCYRCKDCGTTESALFSDGLCPNCSGRLHPEQGLSLKPHPEALAAGKGKNVELLVKYDPMDVAKRWEALKGNSLTSLVIDETKEEDVQCLKLAIARDYMNIRRKQLAEQLTTLKAWLGA